jgi:hypothetical protein
MLNNCLINIFRKYNPTVINDLSDRLKFTVVKWVSMLIEKCRNIHWREKRIDLFFYLDPLRDLANKQQLNDAQQFVKLIIEFCDQGSSWERYSNDGYLLKFELKLQDGLISKWNSDIFVRLIFSSVTLDL